MNNNSETPKDAVIKEKLTIVELRSFPGCSHYSDEEAKEIIDTLYRIALFLFDNHQVNNNSNENYFVNQIDNE